MTIPISVFIFVITIGLNLVLCACPIVLGRYGISSWSLAVLALAGLFGLFWGIAGLGLTCFPTHFTERVVYVVDQLRTFTSGIAVGLLMAWLVSGQPSAFHKKWTEYLKEHPKS
jgi:hypothetical protein